MNDKKSRMDPETKADLIAVCVGCACILALGCVMIWALVQIDK